ncbi:MAG: FHA domain-containing protein [Myxococcaceae bacterium]|jgi:hypothetical protein|nr:FHA domain-containing protein [Myxococcaceae bacterium]MCA3016322.1 FHA domain-containing protein [Myxococcaceae bacterium]
MRLDILCAGESTPVDLIDGPATLGGGQRDDIRLDGLPVKLVTLVVDGPRLTVTCARPLRIGDQLFPAHVTRLVLPGEVLTLPNQVVVRRPEDETTRERRANKSTEALARELLSGELPRHESRAATLTCVAGANEGHVFPIAFLDTSLGRADDVDVRLLDRSVSRRHARVVHHGKAYFVEDCGTTNGIYVNGQRVSGARRLATGDVLELGHTMLRFEDGERAPEERTVVQRAPEPEGPPAPAPTPDDARPPALPPDETTSSGASATTARLPQRRRLTKADVAIVTLGTMLVLSGLTTAALLWRG